MNFCWTILPKLAEMAPPGICKLLLRIVYFFAIVHIRIYSSKIHCWRGIVLNVLLAKYHADFQSRGFCVPCHIESEFSIKHRDQRAEIGMVERLYGWTFFSYHAAGYSY